LLKDLTFILSLLKTFIIKPAFLISFTITIPFSVLILIILINSAAILTFMLTFITLIISVLALAELTLLFTLKIAVALSLTTYILTEP
jgi:hypothetical protein